MQSILDAAGNGRRRGRGSDRPVGEAEPSDRHHASGADSLALPVDSGDGDGAGDHDRGRATGHRATSLFGLRLTVLLGERHKLIERETVPNLSVLVGPKYATRFDADMSNYLVLAIHDLEIVELPRTK